MPTFHSAEHHQTIDLQERDKTRNPNGQRHLLGKNANHIHKCMFTHSHTHIHTACMNSLLVLSEAERDSAVWFNATTSVTSQPLIMKTHTHSHKEEESWLCLQPVYLLGDRMVIIISFIAHPALNTWQLKMFNCCHAVLEVNRTEALSRF